MEDRQTGKEYTDTRREMYKALFQKEKSEEGENQTAGKKNLTAFPVKKNATHTELLKGVKNFKPILEAIFIYITSLLLFANLELVLENFEAIFEQKIGGYEIELKPSRDYKTS